MNGPLLISLLPPEQQWESMAADPDSAVFLIVLLLAGTLLAFLLRDCGR